MEYRNVQPGGARDSLQGTSHLTSNRKRPQQYVENFFFVIDRDTCHNVKGNHLYGYAWLGDKLYVNADLPREIREIPLDSVGSYVQVREEAGVVTIRQDWTGAYGLYLYRDEDGYFAISNSFMYLVNYLKIRRPMTLNRDYAAYFLAEDLGSRSVEETLVQEICVMANTFYAEIHAEKGDFYIRDAYQTRDLYQVPLNSQAGIVALDQWRNRWAGLYKMLIAKGQHFVVDVSGGFDSRIGMALLLSEDLDLSKVQFHSIRGELYTFREDYEIANQMANNFGFSLNVASKDLKSIMLPTNLALEHTFLMKLGFHKQIYVETSYHGEPVFHSGGQGGENLRGKWIMSMKEFIEKHCKGINYRTFGSKEATEKLFTASYKKGKQDFGHLPDFDEKPFVYLYLSTWNKNHFAKTSIEHLYSNMYELAPLLDFNLYRLKVTDEVQKDSDLLFALIYTRYCPKLLDIKFEGGRSLSQETLEQAKKINEAYPFHPSVSSKCEKFTIVNENLPEVEEASKEASKMSLLDGVRSMFAEPIQKNLFVSRFGYEAYEDAKEKLYRTNEYHPEQQAMAVLAVSTVLRYLDCGKLRGSLPTYLLDRDSSCIPQHYYGTQEHWREFLDSRSVGRLLDDVMSNFLSARVDIKNRGEGAQNRVIVTGKDPDHYMRTECPSWFTDSAGVGVVVFGRRDTMSFSLRCKGAGVINVDCKGMDRRRKDNSRIPLWVTYRSLRVNGREMLSAPMDAWHDKPLHFEWKVKDEEKMDVTIEWAPYHYPKERICSLLEEILHTM